MVPAGEAFPTLGAGEEFGTLVQLLVCPQTLGPTEALATVWALPGSNTRVLLLVPPEVPGLAEALAALGAQEGFLARVCAHVHVQLARVHEALVALAAGVGLDARVNALMLLQAVEPVEGLATVGAQVELVALPEAGMVFEAADGLEGLGALDAAVFRSARGRHGRHIRTLGEALVLDAHLRVVTADVLVQVAFGCEAERAVGAGVDGGAGQGRALPLRPPPGVTLLVPLQARRLGEGLEAERAAVGPLLGVDGALVAPQVAWTVEVELAVGTPMRPVAKLDALVTLEKMELAERAQALTAHVGDGRRILGRRRVYDAPCRRLHGLHTRFVFCLILTRGIFTSLGLHVRFISVFCWSRGIFRGLDFGRSASRAPRGSPGVGYGSALLGGGFVWSVVLVQTLLVLQVHNHGVLIHQFEELGVVVPLQVSVQVGF